MGQEHAALREGGGAAAIGEQAEMANADEAVGDDVEQEAAEELVDLELHDLDAVAVGIVAPAEADAALGEGDEPIVGERDPMGVATEVGEHVLGPGEGRLTVDDPGLGAEFLEPGGKRRRLGEGSQAPGEMQSAPVEGPPQAGETPAAEDLRQGADGEEEGGPGGNPARAVPGERSARDDAVDVHVLGEGLAPGVEDGGDAEVTAEMARVAAEAQEGGGGGVEQETVEELGVALGERVEGVGQGEDDVEVRNGQDLTPTGGEPALGGHALALGAVAVATRVVGEAFGAAGGADGAVAPEGRRAAGRRWRAGRGAARGTAGG